MSDMRFFLRWLRGRFNWGWRVRDLASRWVRLSGGLADGVELRLTKGGVYVRAKDGIEYWFDYYPATMMPLSFLKGELPVFSEELRLISEKTPKNGVVIDAGAGIGEYAMNFSKMGLGQVHCFEPTPRTFDILQRNITRNKMDIICNQLAVFDKNGEFGITDFNVLDNSLVDASSPSARHVVKAVRLENYLRERHIEKITLVKADIQGAELMMLRGLGKYLESHPVLFLELEPRCTRRMGYEVNEVIGWLTEKWRYKCLPINENYLFYV